MYIKRVMCIVSSHASVRFASWTLVSSRISDLDCSRHIAAASPPFRPWVAFTPGVHDQACSLSFSGLAVSKFSLLLS